LIVTLKPGPLCGAVAVVVVLVVVSVMPVSVAEGGGVLVGRGAGVVMTGDVEADELAVVRSGVREGVGVAAATCRGVGLTAGVREGVGTVVEGASVVVVEAVVEGCVTAAAGCCCPLLPRRCPRVLARAVVLGVCVVGGAMFGLLVAVLLTLPLVVASTPGVGLPVILRGVGEGLAVGLLLRAVVVEVAAGDGAVLGCVTEGCVALVLAAVVRAGVGEGEAVVTGCGVLRVSGARAVALSRRAVISSLS
jgi:hypothetical protein